MFIPRIATMSYRIGIVGATGLVGRTLLDVLAERAFPVAELGLYASARSAGSTLKWHGQAVPVHELTPSAVEIGYDVVFFSAGATVSLQYAPLFAAAGAAVVDNSSAWRADPTAPLVVPEVNGHRALEHQGIIANPNCSTIQLAVALKPIADLFGLERVVVATYQSVSGAGQRGLDQLSAELCGQEPSVRISSHPLAHNAVFHPIGNDGWSQEERKVMTELLRILELPNLAVAATCVRLPFFRSHAEAVWVQCQHPVDLPALTAAYQQHPSIAVCQEDYPTPQSVAGSDQVWIGRMRRDHFDPRAILMWVVADNVRKGAATNAVQIAEYLHHHGQLSRKQPSTSGVTL